MPAWSYVRTQAVVPLVIVTVVPVTVHPPLAAITTGLPDPPPVAATLNELPNAADPGAGVVTVIVCGALTAVVVLVTCGAAP